MNKMGIDEFLSHSPSGGGGVLLRNWKKQKTINVWLHTMAPFYTLWRHGFPRIYVNRDTKVSEVWNGNFNCWDPEDVVKTQNFIDKATGLRKTRSKVCPLCELIDQVRMAVYSKEIDWLQPIFEFKADSGESRIIRAAGLYNGYKGDLTREENEDLAAKKIRKSEGWKDSAFAKCNYVFFVVVDDRPEDGIQISIESTLLGSKVQTAVNDEITKSGEKGNPMMHPYAIQWQYRENESDIQKKYHALAMTRLDLTDEVRELICEEEPPDGSYVMGKGDAHLLLSSMEHHYVGPSGLLDFEELFEPTGIFDEVDDQSKEGDLGSSDGEGQEATEVGREGDAEDDDGLVECDECREPMEEDLDVCPHCGMDFSVKDDSGDDSESVEVDEEEEDDIPF